MTVPAAYYNEIDPYAAQWLRNLIRGGHIAAGDVDERSIEDVHPDDLKPYTQCHFFAGIGVWSYALRRAGWPDDRPVWTGSCPCQPFSSAGQAAGFDDPRHLWPAFAWLIHERKPAELFGEQVASKDAEPWLDLVQADMEAMDYAFGAVAFPSAGVGAPHIRDRTYWVANASGAGPRSVCGNGLESERRSKGGGFSRLVNANSTGLDKCVSISRVSGGAIGASTRQAAERTSIHPGGVDDATGARRQWAEQIAERETRNETRVRMLSAGYGQDQLRPAGPVNGLWADVDWLFCRDGKWRPVKPGTFPLAHGAASRVGRLRAYGNAINAEAATQFIAAYIDTQR